MNVSYYDEQFEQLTALKTGTYEQCTFTNCQLASADLAEIQFEDCRFVDCDLSGATLHQTGLKTVSFKGCKLLGLRFDDCNPFLLSVSFEQCNLDFASFYQVQIPGTAFKIVSLREADFSAANLSKSLFDDCDLSMATFDNTNLEQADLRTAHHYLIDPDRNRLQKARFSIHGVSGLLAKYGILLAN